MGNVIKPCEVWVCLGLQIYGVGPSPEIAYKNYIRKCDPEQDYLPINECAIYRCTEFLADVT